MTNLLRGLITPSAAGDAPPVLHFYGRLPPGPEAFAVRLPPVAVCPVMGDVLVLDGDAGTPVAVRGVRHWFTTYPDGRPVQVVFLDTV